MVQLRNGGPYFWVTWLAKVLAGDSNCEWDAWFKARYDSKSWQKATISDLSYWAIQHTALVDRTRKLYDARGFGTFVEDQNSFRMRGRIATLAGKPDLIAVNGSSAVISDAKTGQPKPSHQVHILAKAVDSIVISAMRDWKDEKRQEAQSKEDREARAQ